ncbi:uncharacterized protein BX663DRAFT_523024 [Cokeromyces recurvatus]|uniref:uncharacterized protein n=1 Tax=Cokeromyces recurvatus TaxID=90255 RepID=UPI00221F38CE|nr:uncharacterized protein BX663DRAFT_523024 [Cokeromyces recurvatus]KAI7899061.1 hypothetical protein BX663DRAFT_523024 [Cokeromyces recurvatus]
MQIEISQAVDFIGRLLHSKVDSDMITNFKTQLAELLKQRFSAHWDPHKPYQGNAYRAISNFNDEYDPILVEACIKTACSAKLIHAYLPRDFILWIDPDSVAYRVGFHGNIMTLYDKKKQSKTVSLFQYIQPITTTKPIRISPPNSPKKNKKKKTAMVVAN